MQITVSDFISKLIGTLTYIQHDDDSPVLQYVKVDPNSTWVHDSMEGELILRCLPLS